jgi:hypothetical protein
MDGWDIALWSVAAYIGVLTLVRFMTARRNKILVDLRQRAAAAQASRPPAAETNPEGIKS